jgi:hypothetical protein
MSQKTTVWRGEQPGCRFAYSLQGAVVGDVYEQFGSARYASGTSHPRVDRREMRKGTSSPLESMSLECDRRRSPRIAYMRGKREADGRDDSLIAVRKGS